MTRPTGYKYQFEKYEPLQDEPATNGNGHHSNGHTSKVKSNGHVPIEGKYTKVVKPLDVFDLVDNLHEEFEPLQWIIPDYLPEGLTLLFSRPKVGKSMLALALSLRMARRTSGGIDGETLYLTLDDTNKRRLQSRTRSLLQGEEIERGRIFAATQAATLDDGLIEQLTLWLKSHPATKLIVVDVYARVKPKKQDDDVYKSDYNAVVQLQEFAVRNHLAILLVHHTRKHRDTEDWIDNVNGSTGLSAGVDTLWTLERKPRSNDLTLRVKGRDTMGELEVGLTLDDLDAPWKLRGEEEDEPDINLTEQKILATLQDAKEALTPKRVTELTGLKHITVRSAFRRMLHKSLVSQTTYGSYTVARVAELQEKNACNSATLARDKGCKPASEAILERVAESCKELQELQNAATLPDQQQELPYQVMRHMLPDCPVCHSRHKVKALASSPGSFWCIEDGISFTLEESEAIHGAGI